MRAAGALMNYPCTCVLLYCRYLYYLGRIRATQLEYSEARDCLQQVRPEVGVAVCGAGGWGRGTLGVLCEAKRSRGCAGASLRKQDREAAQQQQLTRTRHTRATPGVAQGAHQRAGLQGGCRQVAHPGRCVCHSVLQVLCSGQDGGMG